MLLSDGHPGIDKDGSLDPSRLLKVDSYERKNGTYGSSNLNRITAFIATWWLNSVVFAEDKAA